MNPGNVIAGPSFRAAVLALAMFLMVLLALGGLMYDNLKAALYSAVDALVQENVEVLRDVYDKEGNNALVETIRRLETTPRTLGLGAVGLFDATGKRISGNMQDPPSGMGWRTALLSDLKTSQDGNYRVLTTTLGPYILSVGRSTSTADKISRQLLWVLLSAGLVISLATLILGYQSSNSVYSKLETLASTMEAVARGQVSARLPVGRSNDQIDRVSRQVNGHLDLLARQTATTRNTIAAIAHDLRAPLNRVFLKLQEVEQAEDLDAARTLSDEASSEILDIEHTFETILRISQIEASTAHAGFKRFDAGGLVAEMIETFEPVLEAAGQSLRADIGQSAELAIYGDPSMLRQMLANLIENASRYSPAGAQVVVSAHADEKSVVLVVRDNGAGIPPERRADVLMPFYRLDASRSSRGAGLGLALVNAIASRHAATLELGDAAPGLTVTIRFPSAGAAVSPDCR